MSNAGNQKTTRRPRKPKRNERTFAAVMIDFGYQIARRNIKRYAARERQRVSDGKTEFAPIK
jgi:hypothetical protein